MKSGDTDSRLVAAMKKGDRKAMEVFYHRFSPYLYAVSIRYVGDGDTARDMLHDSFLKIFSSIGSFSDAGVDTGRALKAWCSRIVANRCLNYLRDNSRISLVSTDEEPVEDIADEEIDTERISPDVLLGLVERLPDIYRTVFNLFAVEGYTHREISAMIGISESASATQFHRAKALLKKMINNHLYADR